MPDNPRDTTKLTPAQKEARDMTVKTALAMELPFTLVGAIVVGGFLGYLLDKWLHTWPWLTVLVGGIGFVGGVTEVARRFRPK
jgi:ATP synthase protein I